MSLNVFETADLDTCRALRRRVFIQEQGVSEAEELDGRDEEAIHILALQENAPVGTARLFLNHNTLKIGRVCVIEALRGQGVGAQIMQFSLRLGAERGALRAVLSSQVSATSFYQRLGFSCTGSVYMDAGIAHQDMEKKL